MHNAVQAGERRQKGQKDAARTSDTAPQQEPEVQTHTHTLK